jgi:metal-dependent amidase/aminoacylase/carboxypeptidase family protein
MFGIGAGEKHVELHHPEYDFPDQLIPIAAQVFYDILSDNKI